MTNTKENVDIDRCLFNENQCQDGSKNAQGVSDRRLFNETDTRIVQKNFELHNKPVVR